MVEKVTKNNSSNVTESSASKALNFFKERAAQPGGTIIS